MTGEAPGIGHDEKQTLLRMSEVSLWLDTYDDIFSDFDPRPYSERSLSDDFVFEAKKVSKEKKTGKIELTFLIPEAKRNTGDEKIIKKRLHEHFRRHLEQTRLEIRSIRRRSVASISAGFTAMLAAAYLSDAGTGFAYEAARVVLEPTGWFITWYSLDQLFYAEKKRKTDMEFYEKMAASEINFTSY